jgi:hypothetical protein
MPFHCPRCESKSRVIEVRHLTTGGSRRRIGCQNPACGYRWTVREEPREPLPPRLTQPRQRTQRRNSTPLSDEDLLLIFERRDLNNTQLGKLLGCTRESIRQVRSGQLFPDRLPHIPRWGGSQRGCLTCDQCAHWLGYCTLSFPEPGAEGLAFANECSAFLARPTPDQSGGHLLASDLL